MITFHPSWDFLKDFYQSDHSIADLVNKAIGYRSGKLLRIDSFENFMEDLLSLIPTKARDISYQEFLDYVKPYERDPELAGKEYDGEAIDLENQENAFLGYNWLMDFVYEGISGAITFGAVSGKLALKTALKNGKSLSQISIYKSAFNFKNDISQAILSNARYTPYLMLDALGLAEEWFLYGHNSKGFIADKNVAVFFRYSRIKYFKKLQERILKGSKESNSELSPKQLYPVMTLLIVLRREWAMDGKDYINCKKESLNISSEKLNDALIYGLYRKYDARDQAIIDDFDPKIPHVIFHQLVAKHIIDSRSYESLFEVTYYANRRNRSNGWYSYIKEKLNKENFNGNRLLLDYRFPYTEVRDHDVFKPHKNEWSLNDRIYLSLVKGKEYLQFWREPTDNERFEYIQIEPLLNSSGDIEDDRVISNQKYLTPTGDFLVVKSKEDYELEYKVEKVFSDFRHDLKALRFNLSNEINLLQRKWDSTDVEKQKERIDRIKDYYGMLDAFIVMSGNPKMKENKDKIQIVDFLKHYSQYIANARNSGTIYYNVNNSTVPDNYTIDFNTNILTVILDSIVDNAIEHGFNGYYDCATPRIEFSLVDTEQYLVLKVCNNGRPIDISSAIFKTRGVFAGPTGHTGLGGYLINKHMTQQGGKVELPLPEDKTWNTEIHLYLKKDGSKE